MFNVVIFGYNHPILTAFPFIRSLCTQDLLIRPLLMGFTIRPSP